MTDMRNPLRWPRLVLAVPVVMAVYEMDDERTVAETLPATAVTQDDLAASVAGLFVGERN
jgi:hypothetical protein